jgi:hypothetical protein
MALMLSLISVTFGRLNESQNRKYNSVYVAQLSIKNNQQTRRLLNRSLCALIDGNILDLQAHRCNSIWLPSSRERRADCNIKDGENIPLGKPFPVNFPLSIISPISELSAKDLVKRVSILVPGDALILPVRGCAVDLDGPSVEGVLIKLAKSTGDLLRAGVTNISIVQDPQHQVVPMAVLEDIQLTAVRPFDAVAVTIQAH